MKELNEEEIRPALQKATVNSSRMIHIDVAVKAILNLQRKDLREITKVQPFLPAPKLSEKLHKLADSNAGEW